VLLNTFHGLGKVKLWWELKKIPMISHRETLNQSLKNGDIKVELYSCVLVTKYVNELIDLECWETFQKKYKGNRLGCLGLGIEI
jgi:hypothetical protein